MKQIKYAIIKGGKNLERDFRKARFNLKAIIEDRLTYLTEVLQSIKEEYKKMPQGNLLVLQGSTQNSYRYYVRKTPQDKYGEYLNKSKENEKRIYARKKYLQALIKNVEGEIAALKKVVGLNITDSIINTYTQLSPGVFKKIKPLNVDDETYIKMWKNIPYVGLGFDENDDTEFYSELDERMRSKSEVAIANLLLHNGIPYKYECPIDRKNGGSLYPDFTILDVKKRRVIYWEHLGRMGDISYVSKNIWKLDEYKKAGIYLGVNLFVTYESGVSPLGTNDILRIINDIILS